MSLSHVVLCLGLFVVAASIHNSSSCSLLGESICPTDEVNFLQIAQRIQHRANVSSSTQDHPKDATASKVLFEALKHACALGRGLSAACARPEIVGEILLHSRSVSAGTAIEEVKAPCGQALLEKYLAKLWLSLSTGDYSYKMPSSTGSGAAFYWSPDKMFILK